jgi:hypothetical protein
MVEISRERIEQLVKRPGESLSACVFREWLKWVDCCRPLALARHKVISFRLVVPRVSFDGSVTAA